MKKLLKTLLERIDAGLDTVMASVAASHGSVPRGAGARMLAFSEGGFAGTIGGGLVEFESQKLAAELLRTRQSYFKSFVLDAEKVAGLGMVCGGNVSVCFQFIPGHDEHIADVVKKALELCESDEDSWIITELTGGGVRGCAVYSASAGLVGLDIDAPDELFADTPVLKRLGEREFYAEPLNRSGRVYVFGGGHVSAELVPVLSHVGFRCTVSDDRPEFANARRFPTAERVICGVFAETMRSLDITERDYVIIMTRGHMGDYELTAAALRTDSRYIGVIGSRHKAATALKMLKDEGFSESDRARVICPLGLAIGAETPAEIAISIASQLIAVRSGGKRHG